LRTSAPALTVVNYGEHRTKTIVANLMHCLVLGGTTAEDSAWICGNLGQESAYMEVPGTSAKGESPWHYTRED